MKKRTFTAKNLRAILVTTVLLLFVGTVAGFNFAKDKLQEFAVSIRQTEIDAATGDNSIAKLKEIEKTLDDIKDVKKKADSIAVPLSSYPVAVINNINAIAAKSGVTIASINSSDNETEGSTPPSTSAPTAAPTQPGTTPQNGTNAPQSTAAPTGVTKKSINVTVTSPVEYSALMQFLRNIENDKMFLHTTKVSMTKAEGTMVTTQQFVIEVYVR